MNRPHPIPAATARGSEAPSASDAAGGAPFLGVSSWGGHPQLAGRVATPSGRLSDSGYERQAEDWYVEPTWAVEALVERERFVGGIWDPACGGGTILDVFRARGHAVVASDIVDRGYPATTRVSFFDACRRAENIVSNPPYRHAQRFVEHALALADHKVAVLVPIAFLASQGRHALFTTQPISRVLVFSRRPSMPPGDTNVPAKGGKKDFCWLIFNHDHRGTAHVEWLLPRLPAARTGNR